MLEVLAEVSDEGVEEVPLEVVAPEGRRLRGQQVAERLIEAHVQHAHHLRVWGLRVRAFTSRTRTTVGFQV